MRKSSFGPFKRGYFFGRFFKNFSWSPLSTFSENAGWGDLAKLHKLGHLGTFGAAFCAQIFNSHCSLSAYKLEDNAICARVLLGLLIQVNFFGDF